MKEKSKNVGKILLYLCVSLVVIGSVRGIVSGAMATQTPKASEPSYMGITRTAYLNKVSNNGQDTAMLCTYTYLIDTYGLEATYKMDYRVLKDENDIDPIAYEAINKCSEDK